MILLTIIYAIAIWVLYHKIFTVYYFRAGEGIFKELIMSVVLGLVMAALTIMFWPIAVVIIIIVIICAVAKRR